MHLGKPAAMAIGALTAMVLIGGVTGVLLAGIHTGTGAAAGAPGTGQAAVQAVGDGTVGTTGSHSNTPPAGTEAGSSPAPEAAGGGATGNPEQTKSGGEPSGYEPGAEQSGGTSTSNPSSSPSPSPAATEPLVEYSGQVEHIFFHPLIVYPELAFDGDQMSQGYDDWFVTVPEFKAIIQSLYDKGYMLVDIRSLYGEVRQANGKTVIKLKKLMLPEGKKPLVLSVDDINYYDYMLENGNASKLVLDERGRVAAQVKDPDGAVRVSLEDEIVPIVDSFVASHPDFSLNGAKGVLALTGYEGIIGYRTNDPLAPGYETEKAEALRVVERLKETGWSFASHGWGHRDASKASYKGFLSDTERWKKEVEPLIGSTPVYIYPYGSRLMHDDPKFQVLTDNGFTVFCGVGPTPYLKAEGDTLEMDRRHIDGIALKTQRDRLLPLFDASIVIDTLRPGASTEKN